MANIVISRRTFSLVKQKQWAQISDRSSPYTFCWLRLMAKGTSNYLSFSCYGHFVDLLMGTLMGYNSGG